MNRDTDTLSANRRFSTPVAGRVKSNRRLKGDLDNIVLKALRKEPQRRYASVEQFAEDIRRHLDGLPVTATPDSISYRLQKFVKRHQAGVLAIALIVIAVLGGVIATVREARIAKQNELRAERRFNDVRHLANSLLFEIHDAIQNLPGSIPARKLMVERALEYLDSLAQEARGDQSLQHELASAYGRIGDVQGYPFLANLGDTKGAVQSYHHALVIDEMLVKENPRSATDALHLATIYRRLAETDSMTRNLAGAVQEGKKAVEIGDLLSHEFPHDKNVLKGLVQDYQTLAGIEGGNSSSNLGDTAGALKLHQKVVEIAGQLCADGEADAPTRRMLAGAELRLGDQLVLTGSWKTARAPYQRGLGILQELLSSTDATSQADLAEALTRVGSTELAQGDFASAEKIYRKCLAIEKALYGASATNVYARIGLLSAYINLGDVASKNGETRQSLAALHSAQGIAMQTIAVSPTVEVRNLQGLAHVVAGEAWVRSGDTITAAREFNAAISIYDSLDKEDPRNVDNRLCLAAAYNRLGDALLKQRRLEQARNAFRQAMQLAQSDDNDSNAQRLYVIADSNAGLGDAARIEASLHTQPQASTNSWQEAQSYYQHSLNTWQKVREPGIESPDGFECTPPKIVAQRLKLCQDALKRWGNKAKSRME